MVEHLPSKPSKHKALTSNPSTAKKKKKSEASNFRIFKEKYRVSY
jgi:hypothetical protein